MRRPEFQMSTPDALALFERAPFLHLAGAADDGTPVLRTLHGVVEGDAVWFHAAPKGEKPALIGRRVVVSVEEDLARLPSVFFDAERACPATTLYASAQAHGTLALLEDLPRKARVLQALMVKLQPQGGHAPITADDPRYRAAVKGILVAGVRLDRVTGKAKLLQNKSPEDRARVCARLWERGEPGDPRTIALVLAAAPTPTPPFLAAPAGATLHPWLDDARAAEATDLVADAYWNDRYTRDEIERAHRGATAWVGATDAAGRLIATARAISDGGKLAWIYDVAVAAPARGRGLGRRVVELLLAHSRVRGAARVYLGTRDRQALYAGLGFVDVAHEPARPYTSTTMVRTRE